MELIDLDQGVFRGFVFGLVHVGILVIGYYSGWSINRLLKLASSGHIAGMHFCSPAAPPGQWALSSKGSQKG